MPSYKSIFVERGHLVIPLIAIIYFLTNGYTPMRAALVGIVLAIVSSCLRKSTRITFKDFVNGMINGFPKAFWAYLLPAQPPVLSSAL